MKLQGLSILLLLSGGMLLSCKGESQNAKEAAAEMSAETAESVNRIPVNPLKEAYFGETHVHTSASMDAFIGGSRITADDAY
ncbi:MAG: DUF3604 domain-containing protein, partial [Robiginitalea sp.]